MMIIYIISISNIEYYLIELLIVTPNHMRIFKDLDRVPLQRWQLEFESHFLHLKQLQEDINASLIK